VRVLLVALASLTMAQHNAPSNSVPPPDQTTPTAADAQPEASDADGAAGPQLGDLFGYAEGARDVGTGFARFFKSVGTGVVAGAATLVSAPIAGAREGGAKGFAAGLGLGLVGAVVLPVTGMVYGCAEVAKGAANTPGALKAQQADLEWDHDAKVSGRLRCVIPPHPPPPPPPPFFVVVCLSGDIASFLPQTSFYLALGVRGLPT
jgi:hypothetical protein